MGLGLGLCLVQGHAQTPNINRPGSTRTSCPGGLVRTLASVEIRIERLERSKDLQFCHSSYEESLEDSLNMFH